MKKITTKFAFLFVLGRVNGDVMNPAHEPLNVMDNPTDYSTKTKRGIHLSKWLAFVILVIFSLALVTASLLVYNYAACPRTDTLENVTKYELCHCDQAKLLVLPLTTESSKSVIPLETTTLRTKEVKPLHLRLPTNVKPEKYYLKIVPYIFDGSFTYDGEVSIVINIVNETREICFHVVDLLLHEINVYGKDSGKDIKVLKRIEDPRRNFNTVVLKERLEAGKKYVMNISFSGILNDNLHGFYSSSYEENGIKK